MLFRDWMENVFQKCDVTEIVPDSKTVDMGDSKISLKNDVQMTGQNETFLLQKFLCFFPSIENTFSTFSSIPS